MLASKYYKEHRVVYLPIFSAVTAFLAALTACTTTVNVTAVYKILLSEKSAIDDIKVLYYRNRNGHGAR
jgi:hypothetical protein